MLEVGPDDDLLTGEQEEALPAKYHELFRKYNKEQLVPFTVLDCTKARLCHAYPYHNLAVESKAYQKAILALKLP